MKNIEEIQQRISIFDDSEELAEWLNSIKKDIPIKHKYIVGECAVQIDRLWELVNEMEQYIIEQEKKKD